MPKKLHSIRKTYTVTDEELKLLNEIKDKALSKKQVLNDSQIVRLGIHQLAKFPVEKLIKATQALPTLTKGKIPAIKY